MHESPDPLVLSRPIAHSEMPIFKPPALEISPRETLIKFSLSTGNIGKVSQHELSSASRGHWR